VDSPQTYRRLNMPVQMIELEEVTIDEILGLWSREFE
jgi:hypothetical protein